MTPKAPRKAARTRATTDLAGIFTALVYFLIDPATGVQEIVTAKG